MQAVQQDGRALSYASEKLQSNEAVVLAAVQQNGRALSYASEKLRSKESKGWMFHPDPPDESKTGFIGEG